MWFVWLLGVIIRGVIWGCATNAVVNNKGYNENWFWWGFFFGFIALIVALTKPECYISYDYQSSSLLSQAAQEESGKRMLRNDGWKCQCGRVNPSYTGTCACGRSKDMVDEQKRKAEEERKKAEEEKKSQEKLAEDNLKLDNLKKMKELLDVGAITQEEYDTKKKQLLDI
ncbi:MAG TPA: hypothetical protein DHW61_16095 [Lachnoclostridium phytofermentans]|uniref:SHOCT domain-containing protein n=1 Tax=Lachnoclostridium phytofermentans TaxID=66219 RepID=A0A3D2X9V9_9FIRM|nr:SHOCT domain-containing protein [Lachnoclostridium sp.]HCL03902.1 hypothetical protein [Lachnoclostridium phytofermentans]